MRGYAATRDANAYLKHGVERQPTDLALLIPALLDQVARCARPRPCRRSAASRAAQTSGIRRLTNEHVTNRLDDGQRRFGWMVDGDPNTPAPPATLARTGQAVELEIEWSDDPQMIYKRWFSRAAEWGDDPDKTKFRYQPPDVLWFQDTDGSVTLVGCLPQGYNDNFATDIARGRISVGRTIFGGPRTDYKKIHGLRSYIPGISQWLDLRSMNYEIGYAENGRIQSLEVSLSSPEPIPLHRNLSLCARPTFRFQPPSNNDTSHIDERIVIETTGKTLRPWSDHEALHSAVRDLIAISAWRPYNLTEIRVQRQDDPHRVLSGDAVEERWSPAILNRMSQYPDSPKRPRFLFTFEQVRAAGVRRWIELRKKYARGIAPILHTLGQRDIAIEIQVAQAGIGLDGIGYQQALESGSTLKVADAESHRARLKRVYRSIPANLPFSEEPWATQSADAYNAVKHANRQVSSFEQLVEVRRMHQLLLRAWVAQKIGMRVGDLQTAVDRDPMSGPVVFYT
jgi:hypothetical protein